MRIASQYVTWTSIFFLAQSPAIAVAANVLSECSVIVDNDRRLACFDRVAASLQENRKDAQAMGSDPDGEPQLAPVASAQLRVDTPENSRLAQHWELSAENKRGILGFRPHHANYLVATYTDSPNSAPYQPLRQFGSDDARLSHAELSFQLGFKMKLIENLMDGPGDLWFGYTQHSFWQAGNRKASSPFRESNYQPELMVVFPMSLEFGGVKARFVNLGLTHQSNGQASTLSRSWNRVYAQVGLERGDLAVLARLWHRLHEDESDDNPDIVRFMGRGDLTGTYRWNGHELSLLTRYNFQSRKGGVQLGWTFPLAGHVNGYMQFFSGFGYSLIDYNHSQNVLGLGVLVTY